MLALVIAFTFLTSGDFSFPSAETFDSFEDSASETGIVGFKGDLSLFLEEPLVVGLPLGVRGVMTDLVLVLAFSVCG